MRPERALGEREVSEFRGEGESESEAVENCHTKLRALSVKKEERSNRRAEEAASRVRPRVRAPASLSGRGGVSEVERGVGSLGGPWY